MASSTQSLVSFVLPTLASWLKNNKSIEVTVSELLMALKVETTDQKGTFIGVNAPMNNLVPPATSGRKKQTTIKTIEPIIKGEGCIFIFQRNTVKNKQGDRCDAPKVAGHQYCKNCLYKTSGGGLTRPKKDQKESGLTSTIVPVPGGNTENGHTNTNGNDVTNVEINVSTSIVQGYFVDEGTNVVFDGTAETGFTCYGIYNKDTNDIIEINESNNPLKNSGINTCINIDILRQKVADIRKVLKPNVVSMPIVPQLVPISAIPQMNMTMPPMPAGITMPNFAANPSFGIPIFK
jgi:hypothetical protein